MRRGAGSPEHERTIAEVVESIHVAHETLTRVARPDSGQHRGLHRLILAREADESDGGVAEARALAENSLSRAAHPEGEKAFIAPVHPGQATDGQSAQLRD